jgi:DNA-binding transcriptional ArsR family regulator
MDARRLIVRADYCASLLSALANRNRLEIMCHLVGEELPVGTIANRVGLSQSALSQHLAKLRMLQLVRTRRERQTIYYSCGSEEVKMLLATLDAMFPANE